MIHRLRGPDIGFGSRVVALSLLGDPALVDQFGILQAAERFAVAAMARS